MIENKQELVDLLKQAYSLIKNLYELVPFTVEGGCVETLKEAEEFTLLCERKGLCNTSL